MWFPFARRPKDRPEVAALIRRRVLGEKEPVASETVEAADAVSRSSMTPRPDSKVFATMPAPT